MLQSSNVDRKYLTGMPNCASMNTRPTRDPISKAREVIQIAGHCLREILELLLGFNLV